MNYEGNRGTCNRKARYPTKSIAKDVARRRVSQGMQLKLYVYECEHCRGWHITKMPLEQYRAGKRGG